MTNIKKEIEGNNNKLTAQKLEEEIRDRAKQIYLLRKPEAGDALSDWLQAEKEIKNKYKLK